MAYITTNQVSEIRSQLKSAFPKYKFSVRKSSDSREVTVSILSGPMEIVGDGHQVNQYWLDQHYGNRPKLLKLLKGIKAIVGANQREVSWDPDYGSWPNYYYTIEIGRWNKPYIQR
jgi:hypothetical protein